MEHIANFSIGYVFKGQAYLAKQKLTRLNNRIQNNSSIMQTLNKHAQTGKIIELKNFPFLEAFITEIFLYPHQSLENF